MPPTLAPFGDDAVRFVVPTALPKRRALLERLRSLPGVRDVVLCEQLGSVVFEPDADRTAVATALAAPLDEDADARPTTHVIRVVYDGEDLDEVAKAIGASRSEVIAKHASGAYHVAMLGFLPGFVYLRGLPEELCLPRRAPRPRVPARSLAIAADYTGIYPVASAGGWHLLGRALDTPRLDLGDHVRFDPTPAPDENTGDLPLPNSVPGRGGGARSAEVFGRASSTAVFGVGGGPHLVVTRAAGLALFVDAGRPGQMFRGMPPGGPMVPGDFTDTNARLGQDAVCTIELTGTLEVEARDGALTLAHAAGLATLRDGERLAIASAGRRVTYLAIAHGFDGPLVEGSRNALLAAGIGRPLTRGDVLHPAPKMHDSSKASAHVARSAFDRLRTAGDASHVVLRPGPDLDDDLRAAIEAGAFAISPTSDRAGTRLVGPGLPAAQAGRRASTPMTLGAIELTPSGLVVLGPDHPTTGGYPVPAIVASTSRNAFFARPLGATVRFVFE